jgi:hypothetical protein
MVGLTYIFKYLFTKYEGMISPLTLIDNISKLYIYQVARLSVNRQLKFSYNK